MSKQDIILEMIRILNKIKQIPPMEGSVNDERRDNKNS